MIQRIQTLFLLIAAILGILLFFLPMFTLTMPDGSIYEFYASKVTEVFPTPTFMAWNIMSLILISAITLLTIILIFLYKKRFMQTRLCIVNIILQIGLLALMWIQTSQRTTELEATRHIEVSFCFPIIGIILTWLALRSIIKDINLLKSYDRIR